MVMKVCIVADNQFITRLGTVFLLQKYNVDTIIEVDGLAALQQSLTAHPDAVVVLDYTLFDFQSLDQLLNTLIYYDQSRWLLFSDELSPYFVSNILLSDPYMSVVMKTDSKQEIEMAFGSLLNGDVHVCEWAKQIVNDKKNENIIELTASEKLVLHEIALGKTTKEIAFDKNLSFHTVNTHRKNIFRKLEINNVHEAIRYAIRAGIFDVAEYYI